MEGVEAGSRSLLELLDPRSSLDELVIHLVD